MKCVKYHIAFILLLLASCGAKETNWDYTLDKNSTEPFGLYLAYNELDDIFPSAKKKTIYDLSKAVKNRIDKSYFSDRNSVLISITSGLYLNKDEVDDLYTYVKKGGNVLMLSQNYSKYFDTVFDFTLKRHDMKFPPSKKDSTTIVQNFWENTWYQFKMDEPFSKPYLEHKKGQAITNKRVDGQLETVILKRYIGKGQIIIGTCPEMLTNYALLKGKKPVFYEQLLSHFKRSTYSVNWFSKFKVSPDRESRTSNLSNLLKEKSYRYAFLVLLLMAALFFFFETRRRQRLVQVVPPVSNDSLAFTETIGKLYYGEKDNLNLARKMIQYYLEYIRTSYGIPTTHLNKEFAAKLARKLSKTSEETNQFVNFLNRQLTAYDLSEQDIKQLYKTLKKYN